MGKTVLRMVPGGILPVSGTSGRLCIPFEFGGMNTRVGTTTIIGEQYGDLFPKDVPIPDILINAFSSTNIVCIFNMRCILEAQNQNITLGDEILQVNQEFVRKVMKPRSDHLLSCSIWMIMITLTMSKGESWIIQPENSALHKLYGYYGLYIVRDFVYSNTAPEELWFSPDEWPKRQIHQTTGGHVAIIRVVAYNLLNTVSYSVL